MKPSWLTAQLRQRWNTPAARKAFENYLAWAQPGVPPERLENSFIDQTGFALRCSQGLGDPQIEDSSFFRPLFSWGLGVLESSSQEPKRDTTLHLHSDTVTMHDRKFLGEHYTPAKVVDYILKETLDDSTVRTLDPAVGCGAFLAGWFEYYRTEKESVPRSFMGYDVNPISLAICELIAGHFYGCHPNVRHLTCTLKLADALSAYGTVDPSLQTFDAVVGNPPYVRTHHIPGKQRDVYRTQYPGSAHGRFDLYMLFIELADRALKTGGNLGYIVPNQLLSVAAGKGVRSLLTERFTIRSLIDLGESRLFQAAVLPLIITAKRGSSTHLVPNAARFSGSFETLQRCTLHKDKHAWSLVDIGASRLIERLRCSTVPLRELCTISAGIKSTVDDVFCHSITESFVREHDLELEWVHPYLQAANIQRWQVCWTGKNAPKDTYVIYPHERKNGKISAVPLDRMPAIAKWLSRPENAAKLSKRMYVCQSKRQWYELWVPQCPELFAHPFKIITPDIAPCNAFALDQERRFCGGSAFMIVPHRQDEKWCKFLLGLLNSSILEFFHKSMATRSLYGGRSRYNAGTLGAYPIKLPSNTEVTDIADLVDRLLQCPTDSGAETQLNHCIEELYGVRIVKPE